MTFAIARLAAWACPVLVQIPSPYKCGGTETDNQSITNGVFVTQIVSELQPWILHCITASFASISAAETSVPHSHPVRSMWRIFCICVVLD